MKTALVFFFIVIVCVVFHSTYSTTLNQTNKEIYNYKEFEEGVCEQPVTKKVVVTPRKAPKFAKEIYRFFKKTEYKDVADIIAAMSIVETGWGKSEFHMMRNNYFSEKIRPSSKHFDEVIHSGCSDKGEKVCLKYNKTLEESCNYVYYTFKKRKYGTTEEKFLSHLSEKGFATDKLYSVKVKYVRDMIKSSLKGEENEKSKRNTNSN